MRVRCRCSRDKPRWLRCLSRFAIQSSSSLTESQPTQSLTRLRAINVAYCAGGASCNGVEGDCALSTDAVAGWGAGVARGGLRGRGAASAEAVVSCGFWDAAGVAGSEAMMLMLGMEDADGKNS